MYPWLRTRTNQALTHNPSNLDLNYKETTISGNSEVFHWRLSTLRNHCIYITFLLTLCNGFQSESHQTFS